MCKGYQGTRNLKKNVLNRYTGLLFYVVSSIVLTDQITKAVVAKKLPLYSSVPIIHGFFNLVNYRNPGGAFGLMANQSPVVRGLIFIFISSLSILIIYYFYKKIPLKHYLLRTCFALILGGAVGNMIDRIRFGYVVDFLDFYIKSLHWPAFNVADSAITVGIIIFSYHIIFNKTPK